MDASPHESVTISEGALTLGELIRVAEGARVDLSDGAMDRVIASRAVVDAALAGPDSIYGLNTGLGHLRDQRLPPEALMAYQGAIVSSHVGGLGAPLPREVVRAAMAVRLNGLVRGGSGASPAVARALVGLLNAGVHPVVPEIGSVGAADLMHMAAIAEVALGRGTAEFGGEVMPGDQALRLAGLTPLALAPKDGLAMISANGVSIGRGALVVARAIEVAEAADVALVLSLEATRGNPSIVDPAVGAAKGVPGQVAAADHIRALLEGSELYRPGAPVSVQDPLSFRVAPQVHGALREFIASTASAVETELNAIDDNPLVSVAEGRMISNGNFHPIVLALTFDALRPALAHAGQISERRMSHLWGAIFEVEDVLLPDNLARLAQSSTGPLLRYAAATRYTQLRALAQPASLDVPSLDQGVEDHATNAPETVARTDRALDALEDLLAVELLMARTVIDARGRTGSLGVGGRAAMGEIASLADEAQGMPPQDVEAAVRDGLRARVLPAVRSALSSASSSARPSA